MCGRFPPAFRDVLAQGRIGTYSGRYALIF